MKGSLLEELDSVRARAKSELNNRLHTPYLPVLIEYLDLIETILLQGPSHPRYSIDERQKLLGGFGRIALEDYAFAQGPLGTKMIKLINRFAGSE
jgi:hypothetical protein